jgi:predicted chitinase
MKLSAVHWAAAVGLGLGILSGCGGMDSGPRGGASDAAGTTFLAGGSSALAGTGGSPSSAGTADPGGSPATGGQPTAGAAAGGSAPQGKPCGPAWMAGTNYHPGDIVLFKGAYYIAEFENPGYDPTISTYFWNPYTCSMDGGGGGTTGAGGSAPMGDSSFDDVVSEQLFNQMFPQRNQFYTYQGLVDATRKYSAFAGTGTDEQKKREAAAFLANVARETGELVYIEQIARDVYCQSSAKCPCEPGKEYYGRGPIQISWNYNYCSAGAALGYDLRGQPELVAQNATVAWATGLWFWMTQRGAGSFTPHDAITGGHGFGETIRSINGDVECNGGSAEGVNSRVDFYKRFCQLLGVDPGDTLTC